MTPERWRDIERLYHAARERQPEEAKRESIQLRQIDKVRRTSEQ